MAYAHSLAVTLAVAGLTVFAPAHAMTDQALAGMVKQRLQGDRTGACMAVAVVEAGTVARTYQCADAKDLSRIEPDSAFEIGSVSKTMTAALLADLIAQGKGSLDDPLSASSRRSAGPRKSPTRTCLPLDASEILSPSRSMSKRTQYGCARNTVPAPEVDTSTAAGPMRISSPRSPLRHSARSAVATMAEWSNAKAGAKALPPHQPSMATIHIAPDSAANNITNWWRVSARGGRSRSCAPCPSHDDGTTSIMSPATRSGLRKTVKW